MPALNPLSYPANPAVLAAAAALDPTLHAERRLQSLLHIWFLRYFSGTPFTTRTIGGTETKTFTACEFAWQEDTLPEEPQKPVLHLVLPDRRAERLDYSPGSIGHRDTWFLDLMVKVTPSLTGTGMPGTSAEEIARAVGGQADWLLQSSEREALEEHGIFDLQLVRPSVVLPASAWKMRLLVFSCRTRRENSR